MGNMLVKCCVPGEGMVRVMTAEGDVEEFEWPLSAGEVMERHPGYLVLDTTGLDSKENKYGRYQVVSNKVNFMRSCMDLQPGRLYVLYTARTIPEPEKSIPLYVAAGLVHYPEPPEQQHDPSPVEVTSSCTYPLSDSKKVSLGISPSLPSQQFVQFTRRRESMVLTRDIRDSLQLKEEEALEEAPVSPDLMEETSPGHGWSPSLSSIPESPASSLRVPETSTTSKHICKTPPRTPPRSSVNINKLLKQAILHKHPTSFWR